MSRAVPAHPVVEIVVGHDEVHVNGEVVDVEDVDDLQRAGVHAAAERVAQRLGRPVRAIATEADGRLRMIVHPDGTASEVEPIDDTPPVSWRERAMALVPGFLTTRAAAAVLGGALVCALLLVGGLKMLAGTTPSGEGSPAAGTEQGPTEDAAPVSLRPVTRPVVLRLAPLRLRVEARPGVEQVGLRVRTARPVTVQVRVKVSGEPAKTRKLRVSSSSASTEFTVPAGAVKWTVSAPSGIERSGTAEVAPKSVPTPEPTPEYTPEPSETYTPPPPTTTDPDPGGGSNAKPDRPKSKPKKQPVDPDAPKGPIDPDDQ